MNFLKQRGQVYNRRMSVTTYKLTHNRILEFSSSRAFSLDEMTRALPPGFYTTFTTLNGGTRALGLRSHLDRLYIPAGRMNLHPVSEGTLRKHLAGLVKQNLPRESRVRLILTKDSGDIFIAVQPFIPLPETVYKSGAHVVTTEMARHDPRIKDTNFISESLTQRKQIQGDIFEVLLAKNGKILEGLTSNFYAVKHVIARKSEATTKQSSGRQEIASRHSSATRNDMASLITARHGILPGVTRRVVLRLARGEGMSIEYRAPGLGERFDEAFLTSSSRGIVPIVMIDGKSVGEGEVGAWTKFLRKAYQAYIEERSERIAE